MLHGSNGKAGTRRRVESSIGRAVTAVMETMEQRRLLSAAPLYTYTGPGETRFNDTMTASWYSTLQDEVGGDTLRGLNGNTTRPLVLNLLPAHGNVTLSFDLVTIPLGQAYSGSLLVELREVGPGPEYQVTRTTLTPSPITITSDGEHISRIPVTLDTFNHSGKTHMDFEFTATGLPTSTGTWGLDNVLVMADGLTTPAGRPEVSIAAGDPVAEGEDASFTVTRTGGDQSQPLTVKLALAASTATPGDDFNTIPSTVTIPASQNSYTFSITTVQDSTYEPDEMLAIALAPKGNDYTMASTTPAAVTIEDDDVEFATLTLTDLATDGAVVVATDESTQVMDAFIHFEDEGDVVRLSLRASDIGTAAGTPVAYTVTSGGQTVASGSLGAADQELVLSAVEHQVFRIATSDGQTERAIEFAAKERNLAANPTSLTVTKPETGEVTPTVTISVQGGGAIIGTPTAEFWNEAETQQVLSNVEVTWVGTTATLHVKPNAVAGTYRLRLFVKKVGGLEATEDQTYKPVWVTVTINP